jgi:hypothetical protein
MNSNYINSTKLFNLKYLKYKNKYLTLKNILQIGGAAASVIDYGIVDQDAVEPRLREMVNEECPNCATDGIDGCMCYKMFRVCVNDIDSIQDGVVSYRLTKDNSYFLTRYYTDFSILNVDLDFDVNPPSECPSCDEHCGYSRNTLGYYLGLTTCDKPREHIIINIRMNDNWRKLLLNYDKEKLGIRNTQKREIERAFGSMSDSKISSLSDYL